MKTFLQARTNRMRAFVPLVMMIVPGTAYAQAVDEIVPSAVASWADEIAPSAAVADFAGQILSSEILVQAEAPFAPGTLVIEPAAASDTATAALAAAEMSAADTAAADADSIVGAPVALAEQADAMFGAPPVSEGELAETKGKALDNWMAAIANNSSNVNNNHVGDNSTTGTVNISDNAFQDVNGFSMMNFNTGNNSSINAAMSVNVEINYATGQ